YSLKFMNFPEEILFNYLSNDTMLRKLLAEQITCLQIDVKDYPTLPVPETLSVVFALIICL
ncbi:unnamed protein product, partial [Rotaria sp. Silwood2]